MQETSLGSEEGHCTSSDYKGERDFGRKSWCSSVDHQYQGREGKLSAGEDRNRLFHEIKFVRAPGVFASSTVLIYFAGVRKGKVSIKHVAHYHGVSIMFRRNSQLYLFIRYRNI
jgi:hypothetical protein